MKKKWIILVVVLVVALAGGAVGCGKSKEQKLIDSVTVRYDVLQGKTEMRYSINQGLLEEFDRLKMDISLLNKSQSTIRQAEAMLQILDGQGNIIFKDYACFVLVEPGETDWSSYMIIDLTKLSGEAKKINLILWKVWT